MIFSDNFLIERQLTMASCSYVFVKGARKGKKCITKVRGDATKCATHSKNKKKKETVRQEIGGETITLTFGDCAENHRGMQEIGEKAARGMYFEDLEVCKKFFEEKGVDCELVKLGEHPLPDAYLLIARKGVDAFVDKRALYDEQMRLERDKKAFMYGRVVNKSARHNLCFSDFDQEPEYEKGKGTVVSFERLPHLAKIRKELGKLSGKLEMLQCEANYYYDVKKTFIGFHGDAERRIVVAARLGESFPMHFQWFQQGKPIGDLFTTVLNDGDMYFMSEKAVGFDWKKKLIPTLRHAAGSEKIVVTWK